MILSMHWNRNSPLIGIAEAGIAKLEIRSGEGAVRISLSSESAFVSLDMGLEVSQALFLLNSSC